MTREEKNKKQWHPMRNLLIVSFAFLLNFSAYSSLEMIQSSLNSEVGTLSLSAIYGSMLLSSLVLPPLIIDRLGYRKSMGVGVLSYAVYTAANFDPQPYTLIPGGLVLGSFGSLLWTSQRVYVTNLGLHSVGKAGEKSEKETGYYFGIFHMIYHLAVVGNIIMSLLLSAKSTEAVYDTTPTMSVTSERQEDYSTVTTTSSANVTSPVLDNATEQQCGVPASSDWEQETESNGDLDQAMLYILLGVYLCFHIAAALLLFFAIDEIPEFKQEDAGASMNELRNEDDVTEQHNHVRTPDLADNREKDVDDDSVDDVEAVASVQLLSKRPRSSKTLLLATMRLTRTNLQLQLLIPSTIHFGVLQTLMPVHFMKFWVTCSLGIEYVGWIALAYSVASSVGGYTVGFLLRRFRRTIVYTCSCVLEVGCLITILTWTPTKESPEHYAFFLWVSCLGVVYTTQRCINTTAFGVLFVQDKDAAQSACQFWDSLGRTVIFATAPFIGVTVHVYATAALLVVGSTMYLIAEHRHAKMLADKRKRNGKVARNGPEEVENTSAN